MAEFEPESRPSSMISNAEVRLSIDETHEKLTRTTVHDFNGDSGSPAIKPTRKVRLAEHGPRSFSGVTAGADGKKEFRDALVRASSTGVDGEKEFRDALVRACSTRLLNSAKAVQLFMAKSDEYPRFVWQSLLLSFGLERDVKQTFGPFAWDKISHFIRYFPDVFQRELVRDSFKLASDPNLGDRYGALHAAVLCGRTDLVYLLRGPNHSRQKVVDALVPNESDDVLFDSFHLLRRAVLWRHMEKMSIAYKKVATLMKEVEKARKSTEVGALRKLIDEVTAEKMDLSVDAYDPWVVILAYSSVTKERGHIVEEFKNRKTELFKHIVATLKGRGSAFTQFLTGEPGPVKIMIVPDNAELDVETTVQGILTILVRQKKKNVGGTKYREHSNISPMQTFFLDRFCERTPDSRWTPLHLAAARGDQRMVSVLIASWDVLVEKLSEELKEVYTRRLKQSFYDAKYMTPMHYAVLGNHNEIVQSFLDWKTFIPYINETDIFMRTAFQIACSKPERASIVEDMIRNPGVNVNTKDCCWFTSLHWAVYSECTETVKHVIFDGERQKIRTIEKDDKGQNPYEMAARGKKRDIQQLLLYHPAVKDQVERLYRDRQVYVDASNAILVGAALIASVTFGGWLQPPSGTSFWDVRIFWVFNSLSFFFSIATVTSGAAAMLPVGDEYIKDAVDSIRRWLVVTSCLLILSLACVLGAFAAAGFASMSTIRNWKASDNNDMIVTTVVGGVVCAIFGLFFIARLRRVRAEWPDQTMKETFEGFNEQEIRRKVDSLIQLPLRALHRFRVNVVPPSTTEGEIRFGPENKRGPENFPIWNGILKCLPEMINQASSDSLLRTPSFSGMQDSLPRIEVDRERLRKLWDELHRIEDIKVTCPIRACHVQLESFCLREILSSNGHGTGISLGEYAQMWQRLGECPLKASSFKNLSRTISELLTTTPGLT